MAAGDYANAIGYFTPVSSGAEWRLGYQDINRLADTSAWSAGGDPWTTSSAAFGPRGSWSSLTDPNGATGNGGIKRNGPFMILISVRVTWTGATITASASGDITDLLTLAIFDTRMRPLAPRYITASNGHAHADVRVDANGDVYFTNMNANATITNGDVWQIDGIVPR